MAVLHGVKNWKKYVWLTELKGPEGAWCIDAVYYRTRITGTKRPDMYSLQRRGHGFAYSYSQFRPQNGSNTTFAGYNSTKKVPKEVWDKWVLFCRASV